MLDALNWWRRPLQRARRTWIVVGVAIVLVGVEAVAARAASSIDWRVVDLGTSGEAFAINRLGEMAGSTESRDSPHGQAFVWRAGKLVRLPGRVASAINDHGQVIGYAEGRDMMRGFLWQDGRVRSLRGPSGDCPSSMPYAINDRGWVVGWSGDRENCSLRMSIGPKAVLWRGGTRILLAEPSSQAFVWQNGRMSDLGTLPGDRESAAHGINERGQIVGVSTSRRGEEHAVVWENGAATRLPTLGGAQGFAAAINDRGQIAGSSWTKDGRQRAVLWTTASIG